MKDFFEKDDFIFEDIVSLIENEAEESIYLDFKDGMALDKSETKKKDISKDVSSFANSDGGIIIYGVTEENHKASGISFVNGNDFTKEWLEQIINSTIQRRIPDLIVYPIRKNGNIHETIYIVKIPKSYESPHMSRDKRYYKRFNFESVPMEEYEVRQSFGQRMKSKLIIGGLSSKRIDIKKEKDDYKFEFEVDVFNDGNVCEPNYKVNVYILNFNKYINVSWNHLQNDYNFTWLEDDKGKISANSKVPIYPSETMTSLRFTMEVNKTEINEAFKDLKIEIKLFYLSGEDEMKVRDDFFTDLINNLEKQEE